MADISINKDNVQIKARWSFNHVLELAKEFLSPDASVEFKSSLDNAIETGWFHLNECSADDMKLFCEALKKGFEKQESQKDNTLNRSPYYCSFKEGFEELIAMVENDPRVKGED